MTNDICSDFAFDLTNNQRESRDSFEMKNYSEYKSTLGKNQNQSAQLFSNPIDNTRIGDFTAQNIDYLGDTMMRSNTKSSLLYGNDRDSNMRSNDLRASQFRQTILGSDSRSTSSCLNTIPSIESVSFEDVKRQSHATSLSASSSASSSSSLGKSDSDLNGFLNRMEITNETHDKLLGNDNSHSGSKWQGWTPNQSSGVLIGKDGAIIFGDHGETDENLARNISTISDSTRKIMNCIRSDRSVSGQSSSPSPFFDFTSGGKKKSSHMGDNALDRCSNSVLYQSNLRDIDNSLHRNIPKSAIDSSHHYFIGSSSNIPENGRHFSRSSESLATNYYNHIATITGSMNNGGDTKAHQHYQSDSSCSSASNLSSNCGNGSNFGANAVQSFFSSQPSSLNSHSSAGSLTGSALLGSSQSIPHASLSSTSSPSSPSCSEVSSRLSHSLSASACGMQLGTLADKGGTSNTWMSSSCDSKKNLNNANDIIIEFRSNNYGLQSFISDTSTMSIHKKSTFEN